MAGDTQTSSGTSTTKTSQPLGSDLMSWGKSIVSNPATFAPDTTSHVTPYSTQTTDAMKGLTSTAKSGQGYADENYFRIAGQLRDGGLNNLQDQQVGRLQSIAGQPIQQGSAALNDVQKQGLSGYQGLANQTPQQGTAALNDIQRNAMNLINPIASGGAMQNNPYLEDMISRGSQDIGNAGNLMASSAGRYGSDSHSQALGKNIADFAGNTRFADYNNQLGRMDSARGELSALGNQANNQYGEGVNRQLAGIQGVSGMGNQANTQTDAARARQTDAIGSLYNAGATQRQNTINGTQQLQDAYTARTQPYQTLLGVGAKNEDLYARQLADNARILKEKQGATTAPINWLAGLANQFQGGTTVTNNTQPTGSPLSQGLGGALTGYGMTGNPLGALLGGLGGFL